MINIPVWKYVLIIGAVVLSVLYSAPNMLSPETREMLAQNLPSWAPQETVNLGLDLRGGAHLLYAVDVDTVLRERSTSILSDLRRDLRKEKIGYTNIGTVERGVKFTLREDGDSSAAYKILRAIDPSFEISQTAEEGGLVITALMPEYAIEDIYAQTLSQSIEIVRRRVDELGTTEPIIQRQGQDRLLIQAPGTDAEQLKGIIGTTAKLGFHLVKEPGTPGASRSYPYAEDPGRKLDVERRAVISGEMLANASPGFNQGGQAVINFRFNNIGARRFCDVTRENVNKPFAIVLDEEVLSAPSIREPICGGQGQISGNFSVQEANDLALLLRAGALPAPMHVVEERTVGPSLGADSVKAGQVASLIGLAGVLAFMLITYRLFGLFACLALLGNVAMIFAILSILQATLTLPGIAGIVLTIGMAVDANVLIFERIREELRAGRSPMSAIDTGYSRAMATIVDSNLTTLIAAFILFSFGTGPIKGFSVTLGIGIMTSFFAAIMLTRIMVVAWLMRVKPKTLSI